LDWGYTACFLASVPFMAASIFLFSRLKPVHPAPDAPPPNALKNSFRILSRRLAEPGTIRIGMLLTLLLLLVSAPGNIFTVYLRESAKVDVSWFQFFTPATALGFLAGSYLLGHLVDHKGLRPAFAVAFGCGLLSLLLVPFHGSVVWPSLAFAGSGFIGATWPVIILAMILKFSHRRESTLQAGLFNTLMSPWVFAAPLLSGWLAAKAGYSWAFAFAAFCGLVALVILLRDGRLDEKVSHNKKRN
jgi:predicted MFS family arabinose efflux permease